MDIRNRRGLKSDAAQALAANPGQPRQVVAIYIAIQAVCALLVSAALMILDDRIAQTGGLSNMGVRSILSTIRTVLPLAQTVVLWGVQLGYQKASLNMARRQAAGPMDLADGFRYFAPLLRTMLLQGGLYFLLAMGSAYGASFLFMLTPLSAEFYSLMEPMLTDPDALYTALYADQELTARLTASLLPVFPIFLAVFLAVASPFFYQYRMTNYCILDNPRRGARAAMAESIQMMRGNRVSLLKLDLSFWWFYLAQAAAAVVLYGDVLLPLLGVTLPWSATVSFYLFYVLSLAMQGVLFWFALNRVETTYATAYEALRLRPREPQGGAVLGNIFDLARDYRED